MTHILFCLLLQGFIPHQLVANEVQWFYAHLGSMTPTSGMSRSPRMAPGDWVQDGRDDSFLLPFFGAQIHRCVGFPVLPIIPLTPITEQFSNGLTIISIYLNPLPNSKAPPIEHSNFQVMKEFSPLYCLWDNRFFAPSESQHAVQDVAYACMCKFYLLLSPLVDGDARRWLGLCATSL